MTYRDFQDAMPPEPMPSLLQISAIEIDTLLDFPSLVDALATAFAGSLTAPPRHHHEVGPTGEATHLLMPAWSTAAPGSNTFLGTKIVNVFRGNTRLGLPAVLGSYLLQSGETGQPLAVLDGTRLTHWRTAAASALAARFLARPDCRHLLMVGAGALAPFLIRAHAAVRPIDRVTLWNRRREGADTLAAGLAGVVQADITVSDDLEAAVRQADVVSCATLSTAPLVRGAWLHDGQHLDLVGAFTLGMRETDDDALRGGRLFVDTIDATEEGGDIAIALRNGAITRDALCGTLHDLCRGRIEGRSGNEITVFKSTGSAIEDLAAAILIWNRVKSQAS